MFVAVTGGSGQLGTLVLRRLIDTRKVKRILSLDLQPPLLVSGKLKHVECDVRDPNIGRHFEGCDAVFHLAFVVTSKVPRATFDAINVEGSKNVMHAAAAAGVKQLVYASSMVAYGMFPDHPNPIREDTPRRFQADFPYAAAKFQVEAALDALEAAQPELRIARLRPAILIGTRFQNPLAKLFGRALDLGLMPGQGDMPMPLVWDEDVADAAVLALEKGARGAFNLCVDRNMSAAEIAAELGLRALTPSPVMLGVSAWLEPLTSRLSAGDAIDPSWAGQSPVHMVLSSERAQQELGWKPRCKSGADVIRRYRAQAPGKLNSRIAWFMRAIDLASRRQPKEPDMSGMTARVHLQLLGPGGGDFQIKAEDGKLQIERGVPRPPTSVASMKVEVFLDLLAGRLEFATAQMTGKLRLEGDTSSGFVLGALLRRFRNMTQAEGWRGQTARRFARWIGGPGAEETERA